MENQVNPLKSYFRKPGLWIKLPSRGNFYKVKPSDLNDMGEIAVYPMTAKDELLLKNADSLLNGTAIYDLIKNCAPSIQEPESMPNIDLDAVLLAIRRATYGEYMDITVQHDCNADAKNEVRLNLDHFIASIKTVDQTEPITLDNSIKIFVRPVNVRQLLNLNWTQYQQIRNLQLAEQQNVDEKDKVNILQQSYVELTEANVKIVSECIDTVLLPDGVTVTDKANIAEWVLDLSNTDFKRIENSIMGLSEQGLQKKFQVTCDKCGKEFDSQLDLNPTSFFG
jgi:hypothetical protein